MQVKRSASEVQLVLQPAEVELLRLALMRATFEDTPARRQKEILEFASTLLSELGGETQ